MRHFDHINQLGRIKPVLISHDIGVFCAGSTWGLVCLVTGMVLADTIPGLTDAIRQGIKLSMCRR